MTQKLAGAGARLLVIIGIALALMIPLMMVRGVVSDRSVMRDTAQRDVALRWAAEQTVGPPMAVLPGERQFPTQNGFVTRSHDHAALPSSVELAGELVIDWRYFGIYEVPVYVVSLQLKAMFLRADIQKALRDHQELLSSVRLFFPVSDLRGLRGIDIAVNSSQLSPESGAAPAGVNSSGFWVEMEGPFPESLDVAVTMDLAGTRELTFLPFGQSNVVGLSGPWPDPSFTGRYLPRSRQINEESFTARWEIPAISRDYGQVWALENSPDLLASAFGVALFQPADLYQRTERAAKYGLLFIALTFVALFLFDVMGRTRLHPIQFLFVGAALCCFFLILLALAEHIGFALAYGLAATALITLVSSYSASVLRSYRAGIRIAMLLLLVYGLIYWLLISQEYSLLVGTLALFAMLSTAMVATRKIDWFAAGRSERDQ